MKKLSILLVIVSLIAICFCCLWVRAITGYHEDMKQRCQRYAEDSAGWLSEYEEVKDINDENFTGQYWGSVSRFYAFMDTLYSLSDSGSWNEALYKDCDVLYDHMVLAPEEVLSHMDEVLAAIELLGKDYTSPEARQAMNQLAYSLQYDTWEAEQD